MERLTRYGKETAVGGAILLWVLGAPTAVSASPLVAPAASITDHFCGVFCLTTNNAPTHPDVDLQFTYFDTVTHTGPCAPVNTGSVSLVGELGKPVNFSFCATGIPVGEENDLWQVDLCDYETCNTAGFVSPSCLNCNGNTFSSGNFQFIPDKPGCGITPNADFAFHWFDPLTASAGTLTSFTTAAVAPELNADNLENPLALAVATLLMLSDPRRKKRNHVEV